MYLKDAIELGETFANMGGTISSQLVALSDRDGDIDGLIEDGELNPNALQYMHTFLERARELEVEDAEELLEQIVEYEDGMRQVRIESAGMVKGGETIWRIER